MIAAQPFTFLMNTGSSWTEAHRDFSMVTPSVGYYHYNSLKTGEASAIDRGNYLCYDLEGISRLYIEISLLSSFVDVADRNISNSIVWRTSSGDVDRGPLYND